LYRRIKETNFEEVAMKITLSVVCALSVFLADPNAHANAPTKKDAGVQYRVTVFDANQRIPIELARVAVLRGNRVVVQDATNPAGQVRFRDVPSGGYTLTAWFVGYETFRDSVLIDESHSLDSIWLQPLGIHEKEVEVVGRSEIALSHINVATGNQVFESQTYHAPPSTQMTTLIQENVMGAARAPTGEVHIRGQHGEFTYYVDGVPVPLGVFGGLNEVVDPKAIERATFITGGFPAEYGGQMSAIINLNNRVPTGKFHLDASSYVGSYLVPTGDHGDTLGSRVGMFKALNSNGQNLAVSDHAGNLGFFISGTRQETDRRIDPPVSNLFHDHGFDYFLYGKFDYVLSDVDYLTSNLNFGRTYTEVPFDSVEGIASDIQQTTNGFQTLSYFRTLNSEIDRESNFFFGGYAREGELVYTPGEIDPPGFQFVGDTVDTYRLAEDRTFTTLGFRSTLDKRLTHEFMFKTGVNFSSTTGSEQFTSRDSSDNPGPSINTDFTGSDFGAFVQMEWHPLPWTSFNLGIRYDQHIAPDAALQKQWSPRVRWNFMINEFNSAYLYYGRIFMPTNIEGLRSIAANVSTVLAATLPERDDFYEFVYTTNIAIGLTAKVSAYHKEGKPGLDDETIGSSAIKTPVNIETVKTTGLELGFNYRSQGLPVSGYTNVALTHAYGSGSITGGFLPFDDDGPATDLDHDQRLSIVIGANYQPEDWFVNLVGVYGSGLANGNPTGETYKTGLFDFNTATHTAPSWILDLSGGYVFRLADGATLEPTLFVTNVLDHAHLIKGAYFSGASWEERRNVVFKLAFHL
jgi:hypothetical protein